MDKMMIAGTGRDRATFYERVMKETCVNCIF